MRLLLRSVTVPSAGLGHLDPRQATQQRTMCLTITRTMKVRRIRIRIIIIIAPTKTMTLATTITLLIINITCARWALGDRDWSSASHRPCSYELDGFHQQDPSSPRDCARDLHGPGLQKVIRVEFRAALCESCRTNCMSRSDPWEVSGRTSGGSVLHEAGGGIPEVRKFRSSTMLWQVHWSSRHEEGGQLQVLPRLR